MSNSVKTWLYLIGLTGLVMYAGNLLGGRQGMLAGFTVSLVMNFVSFYYSDRIVLWTYGARPLEGMDPYGLNQMAAKLSERAGIPKPDIYLIPSETPNAFATGRGPRHASIALTEGLLNLLNKEEIEGIMAHELSHVRSRHTFIMAIAAVLASAIMYVVAGFRWLAVFGRKGAGDLALQENAVGALVLGMLAPFAAFFIQLAVNRGREFMADQRAVEITQNPQALAQALWKIHNYVHAKPMPFTPTTAHLFVVSPLGKGGLHALFTTHPPIEERIKKLIGRVL